MNKFFSKIAVTIASFTMVIGVGAAIANNKETKPVYAAEQSVSWTATSGGLGTGIGSGTISTGSFSWTYTRTLKSGSSYTGWTSNCIQLGKNGGVENLELTTSAITGRIKTVAVECSSYSGSHKVAISVGGTTYLAATATPSWTTVGTKSGTGTSTGTITVSFTNGSRALYIKSLSVTYEPVQDPGTTYYTVSFENDAYDSFEVAEGEHAPSLPTPTKNKNESTQTRYEFAGWYTTNTFEDNSKFDLETSVTSDVTLYAKFDEIHYNIVSFVTNGAGEIEQQEVDNDKKATNPGNPTKNGYSFAGWYKSPTFEPETRYYFNTAIKNENITLYAKWESIAIEARGMFVKVTNADDLVDEAKYLITYDNSLAFNGVLGTLDASSNYVTTSKVENGSPYIKIDSNTESAYFTIETVDGNKYIKSASGYYIGRSASSNGLNSNKTRSDDYKNTISFDENGDVVITGKGGCTLRYNSTSGQTRFRYFASGMQPIQLYKFVNFDELTATISTKSALSYTYNAPVNSPSAFQNVAIRFGGQISKTLWNKINGGEDGTIIKGYGVMLAPTASLKGDTIEEDYKVVEELLDGFDNAFEEINNVSYVIDTEIKNFYNTVSTSPADDLNGNYFWNLYKGINNTEAGLTKGFTAVAYINTAAGVVFFKETSTSAADLANAMNIANPELDATLDGSLSYLAGLAQNA